MPGLGAPSLVEAPWQGMPQRGVYGVIWHKAYIVRSTLDDIAAALEPGPSIHGAEPMRYYSLEV